MPIPTSQTLSLTTQLSNATDLSRQQSDEISRALTSEGGISASPAGGVQGDETDNRANQLDKITEQVELEH